MQVRIGAFGKLPTHGDFLRIGPSLPELAEFDSWLQAGMYRSQQAMGGAWTAAFDALPPLRFLCRPAATGGFLSGVLTASRDRSGRRYPFLLAAGLPALPAGLSYAQLPMAMAGFLQQAESLVCDAAPMLDLPALTARIAALDAGIDPAAITARWADYMNTHTGEQLWSRALPATDAGQRAALLQDLCELLEPSLPNKLLLHLPGGGDPGELGFWLDLALRWAPAGVLPTLLLWSGDDRRPGLLFDRMEARYFEPACWPERDSDHAYDLSRPRRPAAAEEQAALRRFGALATGTGSLQELKDRAAAASASKEA